MTKKFKTYTPEFKAKVIQEFLKGDQTQAEIISKYGITAKSLQNWYSEFPNGIETIFMKGKLEKVHKDELKQQENKLNEAYREIGSLTTQLNWLKKNVSSLTLTMRKTMINKADSEINMTQQCCLLSISRSGLY